jgi:UDPglucose 6-dehydrogenase
VQPERRTCSMLDIISADVVLLCLSTMQSVREDSALVKQEVARLHGLGYKGLYVQRTTCKPGTADHICNVLSLPPTKYAVWPEFLREDYWHLDALQPDRLVFGFPEADWTGDRFFLSTIVRAFPPDTPVHTLTLRQAELVKLLANAALAVRISLWNEAAETFPDVDKSVVDAVVADHRLKSFDVFFGQPYAKKCLPKDVALLAELMPEGVFAGTDRVNRRMAKKDSPAVRQK